MIIKIVKKIFSPNGSTDQADRVQYSTIQYKEARHQLYVYEYNAYLVEFPQKTDRNESENVCEAVKPEAVIVYNYKDDGGGHLHIYKGTEIYLMNNDGKTIDKYLYN
jgi:hypothetical protein